MAHREDPQLLALLQAAASGRQDVSLGAFEEPQIQWAMETGLGPLLRYATQTDPEACASPCWSLLQGADLLARMLAGEQMDAMCEILEACEGRVPSLTLLKGISISHQHYPAPHLRPMRDLDLWVEEGEHPAMESLLGKLGYRQSSKNSQEFYRTHHHSMPFFHPQRGVWVEVHRGLVPSPHPIGTHEIFGLNHLRTQLRPAAFQGRRVFRLSDELQVVYIASHWAREFSVIGGMIAMLDLIYLLRRAADALHWGRILAWLHDASAATHLYLLLSYLHRHHVIALPSGVLHGLFLRQRAFGSLNYAILCRLIDRYIVEGRSFGQIRSFRNLAILWNTLLLPGPPLRNLMLVPWNVSVPSRLRARS